MGSSETATKRAGTAASRSLISLRPMSENRDATANRGITVWQNCGFGPDGRQDCQFYQLLSDLATTDLLD